MVMVKIVSMGYQVIQNLTYWFSACKCLIAKKTQSC